MDATPAGASLAARAVAFGRIARLNDPPDPAARQNSPPPRGRCYVATSSHRFCAIAHSQRSGEWADGSKIARSCERHISSATDRSSHQCLIRMGNSIPCRVGFARCQSGHVFLCRFVEAGENAGGRVHGASVRRIKACGRGMCAIWPANLGRSPLFECAAWLGRGDEPADINDRSR